MKNDEGTWMSGFDIEHTSDGARAVMLSLLAQQEQTVERLMTCAQQQEALIREGQSDDLLHLLAERQELIDQFTETQAALAPLTTGDDVSRSLLTDSDRESIRQRIERIAEQLGEVLDFDARGQAQLEAARAQSRQDLQTQDRAVSAHRAYAASAKTVNVGQDVSLGSNRFADERG